MSKIESAVNFLRCCMEYTADEDLVEISAEEAKTQAEEYRESFGTELPELLSDPYWMKVCWYRAVKAEKKFRADRQSKDEPMERVDLEDVKPQAEQQEEPKKNETMKAIITSYKAGRYDETAREVMTMDLLEYTQWILRAGQWGYTAIGDETTGTIYVINDGAARNQFEVRFEG